MGFAERMGFEPERIALQSEALDEPTRNALWNTYLRVLEYLERQRTYGEPYPYEKFAAAAWSYYFENPSDSFEVGRARLKVRATVLEGDWWKALDLIEWLIRISDDIEDGLAAQFATQINVDLEKYLVGFRVIDGRMVEVSSEVEVTTIEAALPTAGTNARKHLKRAIEMLSNRESPQYAKVIHESISAVESTVREITGERMLGPGLKKLAQAGVPIHPALESGWNKLYGFTSDADGIRHALIREEDSDQALAIYYLVSCSAFINLLLKVSLDTVIPVDL